MVQICKSQDRQPADNAGGEREEIWAQSNKAPAIKQIEMESVC